MTFNPTKYLGTLALVLALTACEGTSGITGSAPAPQFATLSFHETWQANVPMRLLVEGDEANNVLSVKNDLRNALNAFGGNETNVKLFDRVSQIRDSNEIDTIPVPGLSGVGGIYGHAFLDAAGKKSKKNISPAGQWGKFDMNTGVTLALSGQIVDYAYDQSNGTGMIESITYVTRTVAPSGGGSPPPRTDAYRFKVSVGLNGFQIEQKNTDNINDVFPVFGAATGLHINSTTASGFASKLWASGTTILVTEVKLIKNFVGGENWDAVAPLSPTHPTYARLYLTDAESCIDMMFMGTLPPATLSAGDAPPFYCLGRCASPMIINTR